MPGITHAAMAKRGRTRLQQRVVLDDMTGWSGGTQDNAIFSPTGPLGPWISRPDGSMFPGYTTSRKKTTVGTTASNFQRVYTTPLNFSDGYIGVWLRVDDRRSFAESYLSAGIHQLSISSDQFVNTQAQVTFQSATSTKQTGTCSAAGGTNQVVVSSATGLSAGMKFIAAGVPTATTILSMAGTTATLSAVVPAIAAGTAFTAVLGNTTGDVLINQPDRWFFLIFPNRVGTDNVDQPSNKVGGTLWTIPAGKVAPDFSSINAIRPQATAAANGMDQVGPVTYWIGGVEKIMRANRPRFAIVGDRFTHNWITVGLPVLEPRGVRPTIRGDSYDIELGNASQLNAADIRMLANDKGWDIGVYGHNPTGLVNGENQFSGDPQVTAPGYDYSLVTTDVNGVALPPGNTRADRKQVVHDKLVHARDVLTNLTGTPRGRRFLSGQARKEQGDGWDENTMLFDFNDLPTNQEQMRCRPVDPGKSASGGRYHLPTFMHSRTLHQVYPITDSRSRLKMAVDRTFAENSDLVLLFHSLEFTVASDGFSIFQQELADYIDYVQNPANHGGVVGVFGTISDLNTGRI